MGVKSTLYNNKGFTVWLTGLSGSGKTTLANALYQELDQKGLKDIVVFDGDKVRQSISSDLSFSRQDREANIHRVGKMCCQSTQEGRPNIAALISPYRQARESLRQLIGNFVEVFVNCPLEICEQRDVKGLYAKARAGKIKMFTGIDDPYETPNHPDVIVYSHQETVARGVEKIVNFLIDKEYIRNGGERE